MTATAYRLLRRIRATWASTLAFTLVVALAGAAVLAVAGGARRTASAPDRFEATHDAGVGAEVVQQSGLPRTAELAALPAVARVDAATFLMATVEPGTEDAFAFAGSLRGLGATLIAGREPDTARVDEFVATESFVRAAGVDLGATVRFVSLDQQQADEFGFGASDPRGPSFDATLVGVARGFRDGDPSRPMSPIVVFPAALVVEQPVPVQSSVMGVVLREGATLDDLRAQIATLPQPEQFDASPVVLVSDDVRTAVNAQVTSLWLLVVAAAAATLTALGQIAGRRARLSEAERTSLAALGVTDQQMLVESIAHGAIPAVAGAVVAGLVAPALSGLFPAGFVRRIDPTSGLRPDLLVAVLGATALAVGVVAWITISLGAFGRRPVGAHPARPGIASRIASALPTPAVATGVRFAFTRTRSDRGVAIGSLLGVVAATAGVVGALTFGASLDRLIDERDRFGDPFTVTFGDAGATVPSAAVQQALVERSDVESVALISGFPALAGDVGIGLIAVERVRGPLELHALEGRLPGAPDEVALGRLTARDLGRRVGDELELTGPSGPQTYRVSGIAVIPAAVGGTEGVGHDALLTFDGMRRIDPEAAGVGVGIVLHPGWTVDSVQALANEVGVEEQLGQPELPPSVENLDRVRNVPYLLAALLAVLAALTTAHALLLSARNRRKDVAVLAALGADRRWLSTVVHWQAVAFMLVPLGAGIPIGLLLGQQVFRVLADHVGVVPGAAVPVLGMLVVFVAALVLANAAALVPARRARRLESTGLLHAP